jgi:uncharacterized protein VirK/YbjX
MTVGVDCTMIGNEDRTAPGRGVLLGPLSLLALQKKTWSPLLLAGVLWRAVTNIGRHYKVLKLVKLPPYAELAKTDPRFAFKYLTHDYLSRGLTVAERASCFVHHYRCLHARLPEAFLRQILQRDITFVEIREGDNSYGITMGLSRPHDKEGEFSLNLLVGGEIVFVLSFTIVPGKVVGSEAADVLLITRIQGVRGHYRKISAATKALYDVAPAALLLAALQGVGEVLGVGEIACISATDQSAYCEPCASSFKSAYDDFFTELGVKKNAANFFVAQIPLKEKSLMLVKQGHKLRTREKREFKRQIADEVCQHLRDRCQGGSQPPPLVELTPVLEGLQAISAGFAESVQA